MKKEKTYSVTKSNIFYNLLKCSVFAIPSLALAIFLYFEIKGVTIIEFVVIASLPLFLFGFYGVYSTYLLWTYYQWDKDVRIIINYEIRELQYEINNQIIQIVKFDDIVLLEEVYKFEMPFAYYRIILRENKVIIVTPLLIPNIHKALPRRIRLKRELYESPFIKGKRE